MVKARAALLDYEAKTGTVARYRRLQRELTALRRTAARLEELLPPGEAQTLTRALRDGIERLKDGI